MKLKVKTTGGKIASLVFLDIAQDCSSEQCLTSSKAGKKEKKKKKKALILFLTLSKEERLIKLQFHIS